MPLGIAAALRHNRLRSSDSLLRVSGNSLAGIFYPLLLLYCFALKLNFYRPRRLRVRRSAAAGAGAGNSHVCQVYRHIRSNILEEINRAYVAGALVRGIPKATVFAGSSCVLLAVRSLLYSPCR
ncbi:MAG: hypothetical protein ACLR2G_01695 [Phascolarctobacterium faecium]